MIRWTIFLSGALLIGVLGVVIDAQSRAPVDRERQTPAMRLISAAGRVEGAAPEVELRFWLNGRVEQILVKEGDVVETGQALVRLDDVEYRHELALAAAELRMAEAQLQRLVNGAQAEERHEAASLHEAQQAQYERARLAWERLEPLLASRAVSQQEADDARTGLSALAAEVEAAKARRELLEAPARADEILMAQTRIDAARAKLDLAKTQLERAELHAPGTGRVLRINVEAGELAGPDSAEAAVVLADTSRLRVRAFVEEIDAPRVALGMPATVTVDGLAAGPFRGRVTQVSPQMTRKELRSDDAGERYDTKVREVLVDLADCQDLVIGLRVDVTIDPGR